MYICEVRIAYKYTKFLNLHYSTLWKLKSPRFLKQSKIFNFDLLNFDQRFFWTLDAGGGM